MWAQSLSKSAEKTRLIMLVLAYGRILQKRGSKSWKNQILILVVNLDRKDIKMSFKELRETGKKGIKASFSQEHSRSILLINEVA